MIVNGQIYVKLFLCDETMATDKRFKMNADRVANRALTEKIIQKKFLEFETRRFDTKA